jgi:hypothetical protein
MDKKCLIEEPSIGMDESEFFASDVEEISK